MKGGGEEREREVRKGRKGRKGEGRRRERRRRGERREWAMKILTKTQPHRTLLRIFLHIFFHGHMYG